MGHIPYCEVHFHPHSFADPAGRLFWWNGQLYRGITAEWAGLFRRLFRDDEIQRLVDRGLLQETELTHLTLDGYALVVRHRPIPFTSYPNEWCAAMLKDAAFTIIDLVMELGQRGLTLKDAHPWNVLFDAYKPVYVDLTSIIPIEHNASWPGGGEFCRFCLYPLLLMAHGQERIARCLLPEYEGVLESDLSLLMRGTMSWRPVSLLWDCLLPAFRQVPFLFRGLVRGSVEPIPPALSEQSYSHKTHLTYVKKIRRQLENIRLPSAGAEKYDRGPTPSLSGQEAWTAKQRIVHKVLTELGPSSVLDLSTNRGWYSRLAALLGKQVVYFDTDQTSVTQLYRDARDQQLPVLSLIMEFTDPTPSRGLSSHWAIGAAERFQCEMVLALSLVHRIVFHRHLSFEQIAHGLALFSKRWLLVELAQDEDRAGGCQHGERPSWYTPRNFIAALKRWFGSVRMLPSLPASDVLLLCEK